MKPKDREMTMEGRSFARDEVYVWRAQDYKQSCNGGKRREKKLSTKQALQVLNWNEQVYELRKKKLLPLLCSVCWLQMWQLCKKYLFFVVVALPPSIAQRHRVLI